MHIYDNFLAPQDFAGMYPHFSSKGFTFKHRSDTNKQSPHQGQLAYYCVEADRPVLMKVCSGLGVKEYQRAYVQVYTPSTITYKHKDITNDSVLFFIHPQYDRDWGGEFITFDKEQEGVGTSVAPLRNRLIRFDGAKYEHVGHAFNSLATCYRMVLVINL